MAELIVRADILLKVFLPFSGDNKLSSCPTRQGISIANLCVNVVLLRHPALTVGLTAGQISSEYLT